MTGSPRRDALTLDLIDRLDRLLHRLAEPWPEEEQRHFGRPLRHAVAGVEVLAVGHFRTPCRRRRRRFAGRARGILRRMLRLIARAHRRGLLEDHDAHHLTGLHRALETALGGTFGDPGATPPEGRQQAVAAV